MNTIFFKNMQELAHDLLSACKADAGIELTARPWNKYEPDRGSWYLLPTTEWPAYPYPKITIDKDIRTGNIFLALYVEKGFAPVAASFDPRLEKWGMIIKNHWYWHTFEKELSKQNFLAAIQTITKAYQAPLLMYINGSQTGGMTVIEDGEWNFATAEEAYDRFSAGRIWFDLREDGGLHTVETRNLRDLAPVAYSKTPEDIITQLGKVGSLDWFWIDLQIGVLLTPVNNPVDGNWHPIEIWRGLISPWLPWLLPYQGIPNITARART